MECRKCGTEITGDEYRMVAEWPFCLPCFERLLNKPTEPSPAEPAPAEEPAAAEQPGAEPPAAPEQPPALSFSVSLSTAPRDAGPQKKAGQITCLLCEREIEGGTQQQLADWTFCPTCYATLVSMPDEEEEPAAPRPRKSPLVPPTYAKPKACKGCGRRLQERATKELGDEPYCPECYQSRSRSAAQVVPGVQAQVKADRPAPPKPAGNVCESCGREVAPAALQTVEGFSICQACLSTDADLAVHLARKRHHLYMERLKTDLP